MRLLPPKLHADPNMRETKEIWDAQNRFRAQALPIATAAARLIEIHEDLMAEVDASGKASDDSFDRWCDGIDGLKAELSKAGYSEVENLQ